MSPVQTDEDPGHLSSPSNPIRSNIRLVAELERTTRSRRSCGARLSDAITLVAGSEWSIAAHAGWFGLWVAANSGISSLKPFDPYPFSLLTSIVSLEAIFLTLFVLASQNRLTREADKRAQLDLQINLLAEQEMTLVLRLLHEVTDHLHLTKTTQSKEFRALSAATDVVELLRELEDTIQIEKTSTPA
jgi:uncharacterized membrane protein